MDIKKYIEDTKDSLKRKLDIEVETMEIRKRSLQAGYDRSIELLDSLEDICNRAEKFIYPQKKEEFAKYIISLAKTEIVDVKQVDLALEIMENLEVGMPVEELGKEYRHIDWQDVEPSYEIVLSFAKRGPEFYIENSWLYHWVKERGAENQKDDMKNRIEKIKKENKMYKEELDGGLGK